ncbi:MotA/TolQ/ExbB proton channel family protein [Candidatus Poribacteria bacterium]|nr:MotA/TolQ/ExbB proton channel family protein [Candidatus Poribacteria bacterium]
MKRLSVTLILSSFLILYGASAFAQEESTTAVGAASTTGTVRGNIMDTEKAQTPVPGVRVVIVDTNGREYEATTDTNGDYEKSGLPSGRYLMSIYKQGYNDRVGRPVTVIAGGDHFVTIKMTRKENLMSFSRKMGHAYTVVFSIISVIMLTFVIERFITFIKSRSKIGTEQFIANITDSLRNENVMEAVSTCEEARGPLANVLKAGLLRYSQAQIEERQITKEEIQEAISEAALLEIPELERNLPVLGTVAVISPLIGLLGTVTGMITAFNVIALEGSGDPQQLAGGVSQALLTTAVGLTLAIPALIFYNIFDSWVNRYMTEIEQVSTEVVNQLILGHARNA